MGRSTYLYPVSWLINACSHRPLCREHGQYHLKVSRNIQDRYAPISNSLNYLCLTFLVDRFQDISLNQASEVNLINYNLLTRINVSVSQWLALTPPEMVKAHLQLSDETIAQLSKIKPTVIGST